MPTAKPARAKAAPRINAPVAANRNDFDRALKVVLVHEGGYVNHPKDPGGPTNKGVTQRVYDAYRQSREQSPRSVKSITSAEVAEIYRARYWNVAHCDQLPSGVNYAVFDGAINSGPGQSVKWLQRALAAMDLYSGLIDGQAGQSTLAAVRLCDDNDALIAAMEDRRLAFMKQLKGWATFGRGWSSRVAEVRSVGQAWATGKTAAPVSFYDGGQTKASVLDASTRPSKAPGDALVGAGIATGTGEGALTPYVDQLQAYTQFEFIARVVAILMVASLVITVAGFGYRFWQKRRERQRADVLDLSTAPGDAIGADV